MRLPTLARFCAWLAPLFFTWLMITPGCGRTSLEVPDTAEIPDSDATLEVRDASAIADADGDAIPEVHDAAAIPDGEVLDADAILDGEAPDVAEIPDGDTIPPAPQDVCPKSYDDCADDVSTPITPKFQGVCDAGDLRAIERACAGGSAQDTCIAAFQSLAVTRGECFACIAPFNVAFADYDGIYLCAAPLVRGACNRSTGCATDCANASCAECPGAGTDTCRSHVKGAGGQCAQYLMQTACIAPALARGQLCSPRTYGMNFGRWLGAVGAHFCGPL